LDETHHINSSRDALQQQLDSILDEKRLMSYVFRAIVIMLVSLRYHRSDYPILAV